MNDLCSVFKQIGVFLSVFSISNACDSHLQWVSQPSMNAFQWIEPWIIENVLGWRFMIISFSCEPYLLSFTFEIMILLTLQKENSKKLHERHESYLEKKTNKFPDLAEFIKKKKRTLTHTAPISFIHFSGINCCAIWSKRDKNFFISAWKFASACASEWPWVRISCGERSRSKPSFIKTNIRKIHTHIYLLSFIFLHNVISIVPYGTDEGKKSAFFDSVFEQFGRKSDKKEKIHASYCGGCCSAVIGSAARMGHNLCSGIGQKWQSGERKKSSKTLWYINKWKKIPFNAHVFIFVLAFVQLPVYFAHKVGGFVELLQYRTIFTLSWVFLDSKCGHFVLFSCHEYNFRSGSAELSLQNICVKHWKQHLFRSR